MVDFKKLRKIINSGNTNRKYYLNGNVKVTDSCNFKGMRDSSYKEALALEAEAMKSDTLELAKKCTDSHVSTVKEVSDRAERTIGIVTDCLKIDKKMPAKEIAAKAGIKTAIRDSIFNGRWGINTPEDPAFANRSLPNVYISPYEANSLYSQKSIFETIINKKSYSILLNGMELLNPKLSQDQIDIVKQNMERLNFKNIIASSILNSHVYGGDLTFPIFKKDTPVTTALPLQGLLNLGILKKGCIDYFVILDRWQTFIIPPFNPTQKDFLRPEVYTVPFLGSDVHHERCARIVTAKQAGYWGQVICQGWGISDMCGYLQSGMNYKVAVQSLPLMIQQMSMLARVFNGDAVLATEGVNSLDNLLDRNTIRTREASIDNPITLDVLGDIKCINRNFGQVPELIRILRQDLAADANLPEPMLFSSEKGNFSSGDDTQGNLAKQYETIKMIYKRIEPQVKQLAKIMVIDALGTEDSVIRALPYTSIHFDEPVIANAVEKAQIGKLFSENIFNLVSAKIPIDIAVKMASQHISSDLMVTNDIMKQLEEVQKHSDEMQDAKAKMDLKQEEVQIEQVKQNANAAKAQNLTPEKPVGQNKNEGDEEDKKKSYSRLEQKEHEKTRIGMNKRSEKLAKAVNKKT